MNVNFLEFLIFGFLFQTNYKKYVRDALIQYLTHQVDMNTASSQKGKDTYHKKTETLES